MRRRRAPGRSEQARLVAELWNAVRRLPGGSVYRDPLTGCGVGIDRERGFLTLSVVDPLDPADREGVREALVKSYMLGFLGRPAGPPLYRRTVPLLADSPDLSWRSAWKLAGFGVRTGADEASAEELATLNAVVARAVAAGMTDPA